MKNESKNTVKNARARRAIGGAMLIGAVAVCGACSTTATKTETGANTAPSLAVNKSANPVPEKSVAANLNKGKMPQTVTDAGEFAEDLYDDAKAKNWAKAETKRAGLEKAVGELKTAKLDTAQLDEAVNSLDKAIKGKNELDARRAANQATFAVADITAEYNPKVPVEVTKLDFYGREIEIAASAKDEAKLKQTAQMIRETWNAVKPKIEARRASKVAAKFESLVAQAEKATSVADYTKVATPILDEVDNLEKVFE